MKSESALGPLPHSQNDRLQLAFARGLSIASVEAP
jgi:hypothetical protein